ncbi:MAG: TlpA disulfide reductase family protein [Capnocytophaga sp.]|nr:TlpA disulfide reductase family protein [Capnocytophaga sp.]
MKKFFILSLVAIGFVACEKRPDYIILSGKIEKSEGTSLQLMGGDVNQPIEIQADGSFVDTLNVKSNYYILFNQNVYVPLYLKQGDEVKLNIDLSERPAVVKISGRDTLANVYLQKKMELTRENQKNFREVFQGSPEDFKKFADELSKKYDTFLADFKGLPKEFVELEKKSNKYTDLKLKASYAQVKARMAKEGEEVPQTFAEELNSIDYDNANDFETFAEYQQLVTQNFYSKVGTSGDWNAAVDYIRSLKSANIKASLAELLVGSALSAKNTPEQNKAIIDAIKEFSKDEKIVKKAVARYTSFSLKDGDVSPAFNLENFAGGKTSLESLKGKLVYIDVWATWCVPCLKEAPALHALEKEYHGKDIAFVSISIDKEKEKWKKFLTENASVGIQLHEDVEAEGNFAELYDIQAIPRFILIDKNGAIINKNAPRPSDPKIKELLNANL